MIRNVDDVWDTETTQQLAETLSVISGRKDMRNFLRDVMTEKEIIEISARLEAARMLTDGEKYTAITKRTKLSSRTVARISDWLKNGRNGYSVALAIINNHHSHIRPVRAE